jgi:Na+-transporting NADH:ubiquinone oxidoreductase subunit A
VIAVGHLLLRGRVFIDRVISVAGAGIVEGRTGYFKGREGFPVTALINGRLPKGEVRFISGDPLMGSQVESTGFIGYQQTALSVIPKRQGQAFAPFLLPGFSRYTASRTYLSSLFRNRKYPFDTNNHGEHRFFVIGAPYDKVMPMRINTRQLVKSVMAEDFDLAEVLGLLEVAPEDFALPTFVDPCKNEMVQIVREKLAVYAQEVLG